MHESVLFSNPAPKAFELIERSKASGRLLRLRIYLPYELLHDLS